MSANLILILMSVQEDSLICMFDSEREPNPLVSLPIIRCKIHALPLRMNGFSTEGNIY